MTTKAKKPTKFTPQRRRTIINAFKTGATPSIAAKAAGIHYNTLNNWFNYGRDGLRGPLYKQFFVAVEQAKAEGALYHLDNIKRAAQKDWKPSAWFLERYWKYNKEGIEHEMKQGAEKEPVQADPKQLILQQLDLINKNMIAAEKAKSFQAFAALQRAYMSTWATYQDLCKETAHEDAIDTTPDEELVHQITDILCNLPPLLQNKILNQVNKNNNVIHI